MDQLHRDLLFDLTFVVAVAAVTAEFAHGIAEGRALAGLVPFLQVFAVWWAWMNFTWFASSDDTDDVPYRLLTMVQMGGVLVIAAGVPAAAGHADYRAVAIGYLVMRAALVGQWLRAGAEDPAGRRTALRYALGHHRRAGGLAALARRLGGGRRPLRGSRCRASPAWPSWNSRCRGGRSGPPPPPGTRTTSPSATACSRSSSSGESVLAALNGLGGALEEAEIGGPLVVIAGSGLALLFSLWWLYFLAPAGDALDDRRHLSYRWGYGHYGIFAGLAALGAGLEVAVEQTGHEVEASPLAICYAVAIPTALFVLMLWIVHRPLLAAPVLRPAVVLCGTAAVLLLPQAAPRTGTVAVVATIAAVCVLTTGTTLVLNQRGTPTDRRADRARSRLPAGVRAGTRPRPGR